MTENERLSMDEVIAHCNRHTERMEQTSSRRQLEETPIGNSDRMKQYWEHRQVAEWLEEIKAYRAIGTVEEFKALKEMVAHLLSKHLHQTIELYGREECVNNLEPILLNFGISSEVLDKYRL